MFWLSVNQWPMLFVFSEWFTLASILIRKTSGFVLAYPCSLVKKCPTVSTVFSRHWDYSLVRIRWSAHRFRGEYLAVRTMLTCNPMLVKLLLGQKRRVTAACAMATYPWVTFVPRAQWEQLIFYVLKAYSASRRSYFRGVWFPSSCALAPSWPGS